MTAQPGTQDNPLRVAIIGSGPSGFYAAEALLKQTDFVVEIDMFDHLPTPYGLVRGGVAPDHPKIKSVTKVYDRIASNPNFRFYGNVNFGSDVTHDDLMQHYHQVIYAVGAQTDRRLGIPGEDLAGSHPATEFVAWYNGHPDYQHLTFDLSQETAVVVGVGNVAMDVARILARSYKELYETDIADYALEALKNSKVKNIYILGRRGPAQAAFTNPEIKELGEMEEANIIVAPEDVDLDPLSRDYMITSADRKDDRNVEILTEYSTRTPDPSKPKRIYMRFLVSPVEINGQEHIESVKIVKNELYKSDKGDLRPRATEQTEVIPAGLVFRSVGYMGVPLPGVPFRHDWGTIPNEKGRIYVMETKAVVKGEYVVGWIKRGPSGIIGTNKPDSQETVQMMLEDVAKGEVMSPSTPARAALESLLNERHIQFVTYEDWLLLDQIEQEKGKAAGRSRMKFTTIDAMLAAIAERKHSTIAD